MLLLEGGNAVLFFGFCVFFFLGSTFVTLRVFSSGSALVACSSAGLKFVDIEKRNGASAAIGRSELQTNAKFLHAPLG